MSKAPKNSTFKLPANAPETTHPDAKLIALGAKLCAAIVAEDAAFRRKQVAEKPLAAIWKRLDAECVRRHGRYSDKWSPGRNMAKADKTPAGRVHAPLAKAWERAGWRSHNLCEQIIRIQPRTVDGLAVLALATAQDGLLRSPRGFDFERPTARLIVAICAIAKFKLPRQWGSKIRAIASR